MKKVFLIHGFQGKPNGNWFPWMMRELAKNDIYACSLPMPTPLHPIKDEWIRIIKEAVKIPSDKIYLVGHSLGVLAILDYLETLESESKIGGAVLVSGPAFKIDKGGYGQVNSFMNVPFDFDHIKKVCKKFIIVHGTNDKNVPFSDAEYYSEKLSCGLVPVKNGGHLNTSVGCHELPDALNPLLKMIQ